MCRSGCPPHAVISHWLIDHERQKQEARRESDPWRRKLFDPGEFSPIDHRRHRILDAFFKELERQGGKVTETERRELCAEIQEERIEFQLREKSRQIRVPLNDEEKRWRSSADRGWKQELKPTGKLVFGIKTWLPGNLRREWVENDATPMETLLPEIIGVFAAAGPLLVEKRRIREEEARQQRAADQQRYEEQQQHQLERNRWRRFCELAKQWQQARLAREFLDALKSNGPDSKQAIADKTTEEWLAWAESSLRDMDPLNLGADGVFDEVAEIDAWTCRE